MTRRAVIVCVLALSLVDIGASTRRDEVAGDPMDAFVSIYTGLFHNQAQHEKDPSTPFASKYHVPISNDFLCPSAATKSVADLVKADLKRCFYVHEKTNRAGAMQYRLRVAVVSQKASGDGGIVFTASHYKFADQPALEAHPEEECARRASNMDGNQLSMVPGGSVDFKRRLGTDMYEVETAYENCQAMSGVGKEGPGEAPGGLSTHISGTLSKEGWDVTAVWTQPSGKEVYRTHLEMLREVPRSSPAIE